MALAEGLLNAPKTKLKYLYLNDNIGMGDNGIAALAALVSQDRFEQLEDLHLSDDGGVTNEGIVLFDTSDQCAQNAYLRF